MTEVAFPIEAMREARAKVWPDHWWLTNQDAMADEIERLIKQVADAAELIEQTSENERHLRVMVDEAEAENARLTARVAELEAIKACAEDWVYAVGQDASWDGWDHHYKRMKWSLLPALYAATGDWPATDAPLGEYEV